MPDELINLCEGDIEVLTAALQAYKGQLAMHQEKAEGLGAVTAVNGFEEWLKRLDCAARALNINLRSVE